MIAKAMPVLKMNEDGEIFVTTGGVIILFAFLIYILLISFIAASGEHDGE